jgi:TfoX/Sxy family transcriptional regulator of competence genes
MSSDQSFIDYVCERMCDAGAIRSRKMFGEFAIYCDDKVVALVCDDQLFVKPTPSGRAFLGEPVESPPYTGAKPYFLIDRLDDRDWLSRLVQLTAQDLPVPKPKRPRSR